MGTWPQDGRSLDPSHTHFLGINPDIRDLLVTASRFALTDPRTNLVPCLCFSLYVLSVDRFLLVSHVSCSPTACIDFDKGIQPLFHTTQTWCPPLTPFCHYTYQISFVCSSWHTLHPLPSCLLPWEVIQIDYIKESYVLCLPVGSGQWEAPAGDRRKGGRWIWGIYLSGSFLWGFLRLVSVNRSSLLLSGSPLFTTFVFQVFVTFPFTHVFELRDSDSFTSCCHCHW